MSEVARGLEGINVTATKLCRIDGVKGELIYSGYNIFDLAEKSTFEEVAFLLWTQRLPTKAEAAELNKKLISERDLDPIVERLLRELFSVVRPMRTLEIAVEVLGAIDKDSSDLTGPTLRQTAARLTNGGAVALLGRGVGLRSALQRGLVVLGEGEAGHGQQGRQEQRREPRGSIAW